MTSYIWGDYPTSRIVDFGKFRMIEKMGRTEHTPIRYIEIPILIEGNYTPRLPTGRDPPLLIEGNKRKVRKTEPFKFYRLD